jgi:hypothetical protein
MKKPFTWIAIGLLFTVSLIHLLRILGGWPVTINNWVVPMWVSIAAAIVAIVLAVLVAHESMVGLSRVIEKETLEKWELGTTVVKNLAGILVWSAVFFVVIVINPTNLLLEVRGFLENPVLTSAELWGLKFERERGKLDKKLNTQDRLKGPEDAPVTSTEVKKQAEQLGEVTALVAKSVETASTAEAKEKDAWVYLGAMQSNRWLTKNFDLKEETIPDIGVTLQAARDIFIRDDKPREQKDGWVMGKIYGLVKNGQKVKIKAREKIPGTLERDLWWANVILKPD